MKAPCTNDELNAAIAQFGPIDQTVVELQAVINARDAEISRLTARIEELEKAQAWRPIETAPKDGTWILGWAEGDSNPARISWSRNHNSQLAWCTAFCSFVVGYITHWTPLPSSTLEASDRNGERK